MSVNLVKVLPEKGECAELQYRRLGAQKFQPFAENHLCQRITASLLPWRHVREKESEASLLQQFDIHFQVP